MKRLQTCAVALLMTVAGYVSAATPDGAIGDNYGTVFGRTVVSEFPNQTGASPFLGAVALSPFGSTWLFGEYDLLDATGRLPIARLLSQDGALDVGFGGGTGVVSTVFPVAATAYFGLSARIQTDGKPLIAGTMIVNGFWRGFVCRLNAAGNFDATYGVAGCREIRAFSYTNEDCRVESIALGGATGGVTVIGECSDRDNVGPLRPFTTRLTVAGAFDPEYAAGAGLSSPTITDASLHYLRALVVHDDGRFIAVGSAFRLSNEYDMVVVQFRNDGSVDTDFGDDGKTFLPLDVAGQFNDFGTDIALRADGRIVAAGLAEGVADDGEIALWQLNSNGSIDAGFGGNGLVFGSESLDDIFDSSIPQYHARVRVAIDDIGRCVVIGRKGAPIAGVDDDVRVFRFTPNGGKDTDFGYEHRGIVDIDNEVSLPGPGSSHDIPTYVGIDRERIVIGAGSIRDNKYFMTMLTLQSVELFADGFESD